MPAVRIRLDGLLYRGGPRRLWDDDGNQINAYANATVKTARAYEGPVVVDRKEYEIRDGIVTLPDWAAAVLCRYWGFAPHQLTRQHARYRNGAAYDP